MTSKTAALEYNVFPSMAIGPKSSIVKSASETRVIDLSNCIIVLETYGHSSNGVVEVNVIAVLTHVSTQFQN